MIIFSYFSPLGLKGILQFKFFNNSVFICHNQVLGSSCGKSVSIWDLQKQQERYSECIIWSVNFVHSVMHFWTCFFFFLFDALWFGTGLECHQDLVHSFCWKGDGSLLVTSSKVTNNIRDKSTQFWLAESVVQV